MPKCELKPWKIGRSQIAWTDKDGSRRLVVKYEGMDYRIGVRKMFFQEKVGNDCMGFYKWQDTKGQWEDLIADLLGIPETIEEAKDDL